MEWAQFLTTLLALGGIYFTIRSDSKETQKEMKDFHGRLCALEEKYIQMMQRFMEKRGD